MLAAADDGDGDVLAALREHGRWLGLGLASVVNVFDPAVVVLGGMFARILPFTSDAISAELDRRAFPVIRQHVRVIADTRDAGTPLVGAGEEMWDQIIADPSGAAARRVTL